MEKIQERPKQSKENSQWFRKSFMVHVYFIHEEIPSTKKCKIFSMPLSQFPEISFNKISNEIHKTYIELTSMLQGFQKCIA